MPLQREAEEEQVQRLKGMGPRPAMRRGGGCGKKHCGPGHRGCKPMTRRDGQAPEVGKKDLAVDR